MPVLSPDAQEKLYGQFSFRIDLEHVKDNN